MVQPWSRCSFQVLSMMAFFPSTPSGTSTCTPPLSNSLSGVLLLFPQVGANGCLVEAITLVQELGDILDIRGQQLVVSEILDALEVTQRSYARSHMFVPCASQGPSCLACLAARGHSAKTPFVSSKFILFQRVSFHHTSSQCPVCKSHTNQLNQKGRRQYRPHLAGSQLPWQ